MEYHYTPPETNDEDKEEKKKPLLVVDDGKEAKIVAPKSKPKKGRLPVHKFELLPRLNLRSDQSSTILAAMLVMVIIFGIGSSITGNSLAMSNLQTKVENTLTDLQISTESNERTLSDLDTRVETYSKDMNEQYTKIAEDLARCVETSSKTKEQIEDKLDTCESQNTGFSHQVIVLEEERDEAKDDFDACIANLDDKTLDYSELSKNSANMICCLKKQLGNPELEYYVIEDGAISCIEEMETGAKAFNCTVN